MVFENSGRKPIYSSLLNKKGEIMRTISILAFALTFVLSSCSLMKNAGSGNNDDIYVSSTDAPAKKEAPQQTASTQQQQNTAPTDQQGGQRQPDYTNGTTDQNGN